MTVEKICNGPEEKRKTELAFPSYQRSSVKSRGAVGVVNRVIAGVTGQEEVDIVAFIEHFKNPFGDLDS